MDSLNVTGLITAFTAFGPVGLIAMIWYFDMRALRKQHDAHKEEVSSILASYKEDMAEVRRMYENNVKLVQGYEGLAKDLKDIVILNTQKMTHVSDQIDQNQYCPMQRVEKKTSTG
jgi:hypothetical protein